MFTPCRNALRIVSLIGLLLVGIGAQPVSAALAVVAASTTGEGNTSSSSTIVSTAKTHTAGNLLVVQFQSLDTGSTVSVTNTAGDTFTHIVGADQTSSNNLRLRTWYAKNIIGNASDAVTVTLSGSFGYRMINVYEVSGADTTAPLNTSSVGTANNPSPTTGTLTIAAANEIVIAQLEASSGLAFTAGTGYTLTQYAITGDATQYFAHEYHIISASEAATASCTTQNWAMSAASFKEASGGGGSATPHSLSLLGVGK